VGSAPAAFGKSSSEVHASLWRRALDWPHSMLAGSTHDTKRSEDVRARLHLLSELPEVWDQEVRRWSRLNARHRGTLGGNPTPGPNTEYLIYQTLVGSWPAEPVALAEYRERMSHYLTKAMREMKAQTSWTHVDERYEEGVQSFLGAVLDPEHSRRFLDRLQAFVRGLELPAALNSLSALVLRGTSPGFPDFYQGAEVWSLSLTDPDNRRAVDFDGLRRLLAGLSDGPPVDLRSPAAKLWTVKRLLTIRAELPEVLAAGEYVPLEVAGPCAEHAFAFARGFGGKWLVVVIPRHTVELLRGGQGATGEVWRGTCLQPPVAGAVWRDRLAGRELRADDGLDLADLLRALPYAVLELA
ncbi:MAG: malto-oligosyltrehalose synthase, partial [Chloroflexota bacterium]|nr:malto-oligosyltrehalose synthase [Chloroflexota bacterium]